MKTHRLFNSFNFLTIRDAAVVAGCGEASASGVVCCAGHLPGIWRAYGESYIVLEVQSFMNLVRAAPVIFCSLACFVQSAVICFFIFASSAFFCFAAALSVAVVAGAVIGVWAKVTPRLRVLASTAALSAYAIRDMGISLRILRSINMII